MFMTQTFSYQELSTSFENLSAKCYFPARYMGWALKLGGYGQKLFFLLYFESSGIVEMTHLSKQMLQGDNCTQPARMLMIAMFASISESSTVGADYKMMMAMIIIGTPLTAVVLQILSVTLLLIALRQFKSRI